MARQIKERDQQINKLITEQNKNKISVLELTSNRKTVKIPYDDIIYIESMADYIKVHTTKDEVISKEKISKLAERLPDQFLRIHRSFIVNKTRIKTVAYNEVTIDDITLNIGRSYQKVVRNEMIGRTPL